VVLYDAELFLDLLQRYPLRFRNHGLDPDELKHHHAGKERENIAGREGGDHSRKKGCEQGGEDPVREAAEGLAFGAMTIRKYLRDKNPNDGALSDGVGRDERKDANRND